MAKIKEQDQNNPEVKEQDIEVGKDAHVNLEAYGSKKHYAVWKVEIKNGKAEQLKELRQVKITDEQAETLNAGIIDGGNTYAEMYYPA